MIWFRNFLSFLYNKESNKNIFSKGKLLYIYVFNITKLSNFYLIKNNKKTLLCAIFIILSAFTPQNAYAGLGSCSSFTAGVNFDGTPKTYPPDTFDNSGGDISGQVITGSSVSRPGGINKIVTCIEDKIDKVTVQSLQIFQEDLILVSQGFLVIYVMFFGVMLALGGVKRHGAEAVVVVMHVAIIGYLIGGTGVSDYTIMIKEAIKIAVDTVSSQLDISATCPQQSIWLRFDCVAAEVLGVSKVGATTPLTPNEIVSFADTGQLQVEYVLLQSLSGLAYNAEGILYTILIFAILIFLTLALAHAALAYITSLIVITFLGIIAPLILPTILFKKTQRYFEYWLRTLLAFVLTPVLTIAYLSFMAQAIIFVINMDCATGTCGLKSIYTEIKENPNIHDKVAPLNVRSDNEHYQSRDENCDPIKKQQGDECSGFYLNHIADEDKSKLRGFAVTAILLFITFSFMQNVMAYGSRMAGMGISAPSEALKIYNTSTAKIASAANRG